MANDIIAKAEQVLIAARSNLETVQAAQSKKINVARNEFTSAPTELTAGVLAQAERVSQLLIGSASERVGDATAELARLAKSAKMARLETLQSHFNSTAHVAYLQTVVPKIVELRSALAELAKQILTDADERTAKFREHERLAHELGIPTSPISSVQDDLRGSLDIVSRLTRNAIATENRQRFVTDERPAGGRAFQTIQETCLIWAFGML